MRQGSAISASHMPRRKRKQWRLINRTDHTLSRTSSSRLARRPEGDHLGQVEICEHAEVTPQEMRTVEDRQTPFRARLTDAKLDRKVAYTVLDGRRFRNRVEDVLTQLFHHSGYHRGQIAMLVRAAGEERASTEFASGLASRRAPSDSLGSASAS
jgi:uncharacterized damage-inducible protein DinB